MPKPRSILLCHFAGQPTLRGSERIAQVLALQLTQRGYQVVLWTNNPALLESVKGSACIGLDPEALEGAFDRTCASMMRRIGGVTPAPFTT